MLESLGFKYQKTEGDVQCYARGKTHCRLFLFLSYGGGDWWACVGKFTTAVFAAHNCAHFEKRLKTLTDLRLLCEAVGIELTQKDADE